MTGLRDMEMLLAACLQEKREMEAEYVKTVERFADRRAWQSIDSAPTFADQVWAYGGRFSQPTLTNADGNYWRVQRANGSALAPTHWRPLVVPDAPQEGDAA